jgi:hypothetical protein
VQFLSICGNHGFVVLVNTQSFACCMLLQLPQGAGYEGMGEDEAFGTVVAGPKRMRAEGDNDQQDEDEEAQVSTTSCQPVALP